MRSGGVAGWVVEVAVPAAGVFAGLVLLSLAVVGQATDGLPRAEQVRLFLLGVASWSGGIAWGAVVNHGIPGLRDP